MCNSVCLEFFPFHPESWLVFYLLQSLSIIIQSDPQRHNLLGHHLILPIAFCNFWGQAWFLLKIFLLQKLVSLLGYLPSLPENIFPVIHLVYLCLVGSFVCTPLGESWHTGWEQYKHAWCHSVLLTAFTQTQGCKLIFIRSLIWCMSHDRSQECQLLWTFTRYRARTVRDCW